MSNEQTLTRHASRVAVGTTISRILGYIRDMLVAYTFGAGFAADAFYAAYRIPNLFRRLLGEGSLSASFIPVLSQYLHTKSKEETQKLINAVFTTLSIILLALTVLGVIFSRQLVYVIAYGFTSSPEKLALTITLTKLMFPFLLFVCLAALLLGILNTLNAYFMPAIAPACLSVAEIGFILIFVRILSPDNMIKGLAISVAIGGLAHFLIQLPKMRSLGWRLGWEPDFKHPGLKRIIYLLTPAMLGLSVDQINAFVDTICASFLAQGSITALYYSNRLMQLPLAIFGLAIASVALPAMSKAAAQKDMAQLKGTLNFSIRFIIFILVPAAMGLMIIGLPIIKVLFQRGRFDGTATQLTNSALFFYSLGLPAYAMAKIFANSFYSLQETKIPVKVGIVSMLLNAVLNILLMQPLGVGGLALATAIASIFNTSVLAILLRRRIGLIGLKKILITFFKTLLAGAAMGIVSYYIAYHLIANQLLSVAIALPAGILVYFCFSIMLKMDERKPLLSIIFKEKPALQE